jgi:hypothetical protein
MNYYGNDEERVRLIAGLRDLATFLESSPDVPAPRWADVMVFPHNGSDEENRTEIDAIAACIGAEAQTVCGHYIAARRFRSVEYRAVAIPRGNDAEGE